MSIKLLDCTLRDGGYINEWNFGARTISQVVNDLTDASIDFIELGFLQSKPYDKDRTKFRFVSEFSPFIPANRKNSKYYGMIIFGEYDLNDLPQNDHKSVDGLRIIFKKNQRHEALKYCKLVQDKGYEIFINPTHTYNYSDRELLDLIDEVNAINPAGFSIVDTMGVMISDDLVRMFMLIDHNLSKDIKVCFHSHNNLKQSFTNAKALCEIKTTRDLIIDISVMGMGRGAGNLNAELMISYLNEKHNAQYNLLPILKTIDEHIAKIFSQTPWGYSMPYFLAASVKCHPNYASYLIDKQTISIEAINSILLRIPENKKESYDIELIKRLYLEYQENNINDEDVINTLKTEIASKPVLIIAPGKTIEIHKAEIDNFILSKNPFVVSLNFRPNTIKVDKVFISNAKRFSEQNDLSNIIITSNIKFDLPTLNYGSYLNNSEMHDNNALMFLAVLIKLGIRDVYVAGLDGFKNNENYVDLMMINTSKIGEFDQRNDIMCQMIQYFAKQIKVHFITPSLYEEKK